MKKVTIDQAFFEKNLPEPNPIFEKRVLANLQESAAPIRRVPKMRLALVLTIILTLLLATALAIGLSYSRDFQNRKQARDAVKEAYGLSEDVFAIFDERVTQKGDTRTYTYAYAGVDDIGVFTAVQKSGEIISISKEGGGDTEALVKQVLERSRSFHAYTATENDLTEAEAIALATAAIEKKYGLPTEAFEAMDAYTKLVDFPDEWGTHYFIDLTIKGYDASFPVRVATPSGEILTCRWFTDNPVLPEGDLTPYAEAVKEYLESNAFQTLSADEKASLAERINTAGLTHLLGEQVYLAATTSDIPEARAIELATAAMLETPGFTNETLTLFLPAALLKETDGVRLWEVRYDPHIAANDYMDSEIIDKLGIYTVTLDAKSGAANPLLWNFEPQRSNTVYTKNTWGQADVYDASMLPWVKELLDASHLYWANEARDFKEHAAMDALYRENGFSRERYNQGLPNAEEVQWEPAVQLAHEALQAEYGVSLADIQAGETDSYFYLHSPKRHEWFFWVFPAERTMDESYWVTMDAKDGTILNMGHDVGGNG